jgi:hypothetical protein
MCRFSGERWLKAKAEIWARDGEGGREPGGEQEGWERRKKDVTKASRDCGSVGWAGGWASWDARAKARQGSKEGRQARVAAFREWEAARMRVCMQTSRKIWEEEAEEEEEVHQRYIVGRQIFYDSKKAT